MLIATTDEEILDCFPPLLELRPHLRRDELVARVRTQQREGFRLAYARDANGQAVSVCGFRIEERLASGRTLYIDDLVTLSSARGNGYGGALLDAVIEVGRAEDCDSIHLDSGFQRFDAHRLYLNHGFQLTWHHFVIELRSVD